MKTPTEYKKNLDKGIVTRQMLSDCLFSVNKRAKNYRDKLREEREYLRRAYRYSYFSYDNTEKLEAKRDEYYRMKEQLLTHISPVCIHQEPQQRRIRISSCDFENMKQFDKQYKQDLKAERIIYENSYKDWDTDEVVYFYNIYEIVPAYYLYYDLGTGHTFHTPIDESEIAKYMKQYRINVVKLDEPIITYGEDIDDLISVQFVRKVITALDDGTATIELDKQGTQNQDTPATTTSGKPACTTSNDICDYRIVPDNAKAATTISVI